MRKSKEKDGVTEFQVDPRVGVPVNPPPQDMEQFEPDLTKLPAEERKKQSRHLFVTSKHSLQELSDMFAIPERTLQNWAAKEGWRDEKDNIEIMATKLKDSLKWLLDPETQENAIAEGNLKVLLEIQGIHLAQMKYSMLTGDHTVSTYLPSALADSIQKYAGALEKLNKTSVSLKNGGVEKHEHTHKHEIDMDKALQLAMQLKKETGKVITVTEAAKILDDQVKGRTPTPIKDTEVVTVPATSRMKSALPQEGQLPAKIEDNSPKKDVSSEQPAPASKLNLSRFNIAKKK